MVAVPVPAEAGDLRRLALDVEHPVPGPGLLLQPSSLGGGPLGLTLRHGPGRLKAQLLKIDHWCPSLRGALIRPFGDNLAGAFLPGGSGSGVPSIPAGTERGDPLLQRRVAEQSRQSRQSRAGGRRGVCGQPLVLSEQDSRWHGRAPVGQELLMPPVREAGRAGHQDTHGQHAEAERARDRDEASLVDRREVRRQQASTEVARLVGVPAGVSPARRRATARR